MFRLKQSKVQLSQVHEVDPVPLMMGIINPGPRLQPGGPRRVNCITLIQVEVIGVEFNACALRCRQKTRIHTQRTPAT